MKKISLFISVCILVMFVSCTAQPSIVGKWKMQNSYDDEEITYQFLKDGTLTTTYSDSYETKTKSDISWIKKGDMIYLAMPGERDVNVLKIVTLTKNTLVVQDEDPRGHTAYLIRCD